MYTPKATAATISVIIAATGFAMRTVKKVLSAVTAMVEKSLTAVPRKPNAEAATETTGAIKWNAPTNATIVPII